MKNKFKGLALSAACVIAATMTGGRRAPANGSTEIRPLSPAEMESTRGGQGFMACYQTQSCFDVCSSNNDPNFPSKKYVTYRFKYCGPSLWYCDESFTFCDRYKYEDGSCQVNPTYMDQQMNDWCSDDLS